MKDTAEKGVFVETLKHLTGTASFIDDISLPGMLYAGFVRSPHAHAAIRSISSSAGETLLTGKEAREYSKPLPAYLYSSGESKVPEWYCLPDATANYVGEAVAALTAATRYEVEDAVERVAVEYDALPAHLDASEETEANIVHKKLGGNTALRMSFESGDMADVFAAADLVIRREFKMHRHAPSPLEPRGILAHYERNVDRLTVWGSTQIPFVLRSHLADILSIPENRIRVIAPDVGGGFGQKLTIPPEYIAVCLLSRLQGKPVKWIETRSENLTAGGHSREQLHQLEAAFSKNGILLGLRDKITLDVGAYLDSRISGQALCSVYGLFGPYKLKALKADVSLAITNKAPYVPFRGFGLEGGVFALERSMDLAAKELGMDSSEIRVRNLITVSEMPYKTQLGVEFDEADFQKAMQVAIATSRFHDRLAAEHTAEGPVSIGRGISFVVHPSSVNAYTGVVDTGTRTDAVDFGSARISMGIDGKVTIYLVTVSIGTSHQLAAAEVVRQQLGVSLEGICVILGDTAATPYDAGVRASRFSTIVLPAVFKCATYLRSKLVKAVAHLLQENEEQIEILEGQMRSKRSGRIVSTQEVARMFYASAHELPSGMEPGLEASETFHPEKRGPFNATSYTIHIPTVKVDVETGLASVTEYTVVEDCGTIVSEASVEGQIAGGIEQVVGGVFLEEMKYNEDGQLMTITLMDYLIPSSSNYVEPNIVHISTPSKFPGGYKGMGESANICGYAAVVSAVENALDDAEITESDLSVERLWRTIRKNSRAVVRDDL